MLGLFDSGLGGLTVLCRLRELLPRSDILYFADQAHVPYGDRSTSELRELVRTNVAWLNESHCEAIVMACNTSCAIASRYGWPASRAPIFDLIEAAAAAVARGGFRSVAVAATAATVRSQAYSRAIHTRTSGLRVCEIAAPALVPLVESDSATQSEIDAAVRDVCAQVPHDAGALVYGCTHYPLLDAAFARALAPRVQRIDPAIVQAERVAAAGFGAGASLTRYVTSGAPEPFAQRVCAFDATASVEHVGTP